MLIAIFKQDLSVSGNEQVWKKFYFFIETLGMHLSKYRVAANVSHDSYEFLSSGPKGTVRKVVEYTEVKSGIFNLGFGDWNEAEQKINDNISTNNADRDKVLATVASTVIDFLKYHPDAILFVKGESPAKTRLYQMGISANFNQINQLFKIEGFISGDWEFFKTGKNYEAFAVTVK